MTPTASPATTDVLTGGARRPGSRWARTAALPLAAALVLGASACSGDSAAEAVDGEEEIGGTSGEEAAGDDLVGVDLDPESPPTGLDANGMLGLEVVTVGEVTESVENNAFRMDKDGLDPLADVEVPSPGADDPGLDYYDTDGLTAGDDAFGYGTDQEDVLVIVPGADLDLTAGDPVQVSGTIRALDASAIEEAYDVEIDEDVFAPFEDQLVIIASTVEAPGSPFDGG